MAEMDNGEYEVKDEELVDFEGSDYGFGSDEELEIDDEVVQPHLVGVEGNAVLTSEEGKQTETGQQVNGGGPLHPGEHDVMFLNETENERREGAESGEIEEEKDEKDDGVVVQPLSSFVVANNNHSYEGRVGETRRKHRKADLEDGELDDAAMPEGSDNEAEGNADDDDENENDRRERKRRKDRFAPERLSENSDRKERESFTSIAGRQHRSRGSTERPLERSGGFSKAGNAGVRSVMQVGGFGRAANMAPGIMGPGRPLVPLDPATLPLRPMGRGFMGPLAGIQMANRTNMHLQEVMAVQEHMLRSHHYMQQLAHANAAGRGRHPLAGPVAGPGMRPMPGMEFGGQFPQGMMHLQACPDLTAQMNFVGPVDAFSRNTRAAYGGRGPGGMFGQVAGRMGSSQRNGMGRQNSWGSSTVQNGELLAVGGRGQGRGQVAGPIWSDPHVMAQAAAAQGVQAQGIGVGETVNMVQARGADVMTMGPAKARQSSQTIGHLSESQRVLKRAEPVGKLEPDGTWRVDGECGSRNGAPQKKEKDLKNVMSSTSGAGNKRERELGREKESSTNLSNASKNVLTPQGHGLSNGSASASNLIQLGGPVQKSRVLTVSGLPDNTSMSVVVDAFEKQGKVTDFRKEDRGDAFTITFASVSEAISAQRHLHRSHLAGRQITVEYAVHQPDL
ncbi:hypothetical protein MPTK1_3g08560 [Marchantia polymorpha subsp. ruderalis]|uniref:RRM domain-containing protein n=2 Tax=Marchantia polymorpha TaxID=3197 RepID=A0AAF6AYQ3_MARPO|nr:hypothetical protein MARPO_0105s0061 [Marchantia polymorpha]BBN04887.1 hypothetical protein Mp_3g08560 [Marchantia polymorpha subsp. ruderalis]|eukprot:PTQ31957.1 hypothetical protein MARPO_0105s0061 [Marchantia polymorpha]